MTYLITGVLLWCYYYILHVKWQKDSQIKGGDPIIFFLWNSLKNKQNYYHFVLKTIWKYRVVCKLAKLRSLQHCGEVYGNTSCWTEDAD